MFVGYLSWLISQEQADSIPNVGFFLWPENYGYPSYLMSQLPGWLVGACNGTKQ